MKELTTGLKTFQELADWMGISYGTFRNKKQDYLKKLSYFADYHLDDKGKVVIDEVLDPVYDKEKLSSAKEIMDKVPEFWAGLDTVGRCGNRIQQDYIKKDPEGKIANLAESTVRQYAGKGRTYYYGNPYLGTEGKLGHCKFQWSKDVDGQLVPLSAEEEKIKDNLYKQFFGSAQEREIIIMEGLSSGKITPEQVGYEYAKMAEYHKKHNNFGSFIKQLGKELGHPVIRATRSFELQEEEFSFPTIESKEEKTWED
jgi:hypothetical protein